jgi:hypothetical protein
LRGMRLRWTSCGGGKSSVFACEVDSVVDCLSCSQSIEEGVVNIIYLVALGSSSEGNVHGIYSYLFLRRVILDGVH